MKQAIKVSNPLISHYVGELRDINTDKNAFANAIENIVYLMSSQITSNIECGTKKVSTPLADTEVAYFFDKVLIIPILRAGMAMFEPMKRILPHAAYGYIGIQRVEKDGQLVADMYYCNLPSNLQDYKVYILEIVVATGVTVKHTVDYLLEQGVKCENISLVSIISSKYGVEELGSKYPQLNMITCEIDETLTDKGYIVPGLGDAGDRYNGY